MSIEIIKCADRSEWLETRRRIGIGGSDAAKIVGVSRFGNALSLYHEKLGLAEPDRDEQEQFYWGNALEEPIARRYVEETGRAVIDPGRHTIQRDTERPWMFATLDRDVIPQEGPRAVGVLEIKTGHFMTRDAWDEGEIPEEYMVQVQHQLAVTGRKWASIAVLIGGCMFRYRDIVRDDEFITLLIEEERRFWSDLMARREPSIDGTEHTRRILHQLHPKDNGQTVTLPQETSEYLKARTIGKNLIAEGAAMVLEAENHLKAAIGDNTYAEIAGTGESFSWKWQRGSTYTVERSDTRVFRVAAPKKRKEIAA